MDSIEDEILKNRIEEKQKVLDDGWKRDPGQCYINGHPVSYREYYDYMEEIRIQRAKDDAELAFYKSCTSTGEEWEIDSDGLEYIP